VAALASIFSSKVGIRREGMLGKLRVQPLDGCDQNGGSISAVLSAILS